MYHGPLDRTAFLRGERDGLRDAARAAMATASYARAAWTRATGETEATVACERFRRACRVAAELKDEAAEIDADLDEYGDLEEYGCVA